MKLDHTTPYPTTQDEAGPMLRHIREEGLSGGTGIDWPLLDEAEARTASKLGDFFAQPDLVASGAWLLEWLTQYLRFLRRRHVRADLLEHLEAHEAAGHDSIPYLCCYEDGADPEQEDPTDQTA